MTDPELSDDEIITLFAQNGITVTKETCDPLPSVEEFWLTKVLADYGRKCREIAVGRVDPKK